MTTNSSAPGNAPAAPAEKPRRFPWAALIVIVILGGLVAAVLIPQYGDYADRAHVAEAFIVLGVAKIPLAEYYEERKIWPSSLAEIGVTAVGKRVQSVAITKGASGSGEIELTATLRVEGVDRRVAGKSVRLVSADGGRNWRCLAGTVPQSPLPHACREPR